MDLVSAISEEVDFLELFICDMLQTECFVPSVGKDVKGDLAAYWEREAVVGELLSKHFHEGCAYTVLLELSLVFYAAKGKEN